MKTDLHRLLESLCPGQSVKLHADQLGHVEITREHEGGYFVLGKVALEFGCNVDPDGNASGHPGIARDVLRRFDLWQRAGHATASIPGVDLAELEDDGA